jgi:hypothetical protein
VAALAGAAIAAVRLSAAKAARIMGFIRFLHLLSGTYPASTGKQLGMVPTEVNAATQHWTYAPGGWAIER